MLLISVLTEVWLLKKQYVSGNSGLPTSTPCIPSNLILDGLGNSLMLTISRESDTSKQNL